MTNPMYRLIDTVLATTKYDCYIISLYSSVIDSGKEIWNKTNFSSVDYFKEGSYRAIQSEILNQVCLLYTLIPLCPSLMSFEKTVFDPCKNERAIEILPRVMVHTQCLAAAEVLRVNWFWPMRALST